MIDKTEQVLLYLLKVNGKMTITEWLKFAYLSDLISIQRTGNKLTDFEYRRHGVGPFDVKIYRYVEDLVNKSHIKEDILYNSIDYTEYLIYKPFYDYESSCFNFNLLNEDEIKILEEVCSVICGYGSKALADVVFKTKPMRQLGANQDNWLGMNKVLDLYCE